MKVDDMNLSLDPILNFDMDDSSRTFIELERVVVYTLDFIVMVMVFVASKVVMCVSMEL